MSSDTPPVTDPRSATSRASLVLLGVALTLASVSLETDLLPALLSGLAGLGLVGHQLAEAWHFRHPPAPVHGHTPEGLPAVKLPRGVLPERVSEGAAAVGAAAVLGGWVSGGLPGPWWVDAPIGAASAVTLQLVVMGWNRPAGGLTLTRDEIRYRHTWVRWTAPWSDVAHVEAEPGEHLRVVFPEGQAPRTTGRLPLPRRLRRHPDTRVVRTRYLAGGSELASYLVARAAQEPDFRARLGDADLVRLAAAQPTSQAATSNSTHNG